VLDPSDFNVASIAVGDLAGTQVIKRKVTNVSGQTATFTAVVSAPTGMTVSVSPSSFTLGASKSQALTITITNVSAAVNSYQNGAIVWTSDKGHTARIPVVVRPVALAAPASVSSTGGAVSYNVTFGYTGSFSAALRGLVAPTLTPGSVAQDPDQTFNPADPTGTVAIPVTIPAGTTYARFSLFDADVAPGSDIDMFVYQGATLVGSSASGTSAEEVNFAFATPTAGPVALTVFVHGWGVPSGTTPFTLYQWSVGTAAAGNATISAPSAATLGASGTVTITPDAGLAAGRWLGTVVYSGSSGMPTTVVTVTK